MGSDLAGRKFPSMTNGDAVFSWIDDYCAGHPSDQVARASAGFAEYLSNP
jgi:hypothetical protein